MRTTRARHGRVAAKRARSKGSGYRGASDPTLETADPPPSPKRSPCPNPERGSLRTPYNRSRTLSLRIATGRAERNTRIKRRE